MITKLPPNPSKTGPSADRPTLSGEREDLRKELSPEPIAGKGKFGTEGTSDLASTKEIDKALKDLATALRSGQAPGIEKAYLEFTSALEKLGAANGWDKGELTSSFKSIFLASKLATEPLTVLSKLLEHPASLTDQQLATAAPLALAEIEKLRPGLNGVRIHSLGLNFRFIQDMMTMQDGDPGLDGKNVCGPIAIYYLLAEKGVFGSPVDKQAAAANGEKILRAAAPGVAGTHPDNLARAVEKCTDGKNTLKQHQFDNAKDTLTFTAAHVPCIIKFGSSLLSQHYDTIISVKTEPGRGTFYGTASGLLISESMLLKMVDQRPYACRVWTLEKKQ
jgi:hypothetical protein